MALLADPKVQKWLLDEQHAAEATEKTEAARAVAVKPPLSTTRTKAVRLAIRSTGLRLSSNSR
jgi:hypothetical protein